MSNLVDNNLNTIARVVREEVLAAGWGPRSCIATTRAVIDTLAYFGLHARPQPVTVEAYNAAAAQALNANRALSAEELPPRAWSVGVVGTCIISGPNWDGHLVALLDAGSRSWLIDASLDQLSRPQRAIDLRPTALLLDRTWDGQVMQLQGENGLVLLYRSMAISGNWRDARDWRGHGFEMRAAVSAAIRKLRA